MSGFKTSTNNTFLKCIQLRVLFVCIIKQKQINKYIIRKWVSCLFLYEIRQVFYKKVFEYTKYIPTL